MKHVLVVDTDTTFLHAMQTALPTYVDELDVVVAQSSAEAIDMLRMQGADIVCFDLHMQATEEFQLWAFMLIHCPTIPVVVVTELDPAALAERINGLGFIDYLHKPLDYREAADMIRMQLDASANGYMVGVTMFGMLELLSLHCITGVLKLYGHERNGILAFQDGELIAAVCGEVVGTEAVHYLLAMPLSHLAVHTGIAHPVRTIYTPLPQILEDVLRRQAQNTTSTSAAATTAPAVTTPATQEPDVPADVPTLCARARHDLAQNNLARAQTAITHALDLDPLSIDAHVLLAQLYAQQGEHDQAGTTVFGMLELLSLQNTTGVLQLRVHGHDGLLAFRHGQLIAASWNHIVGTEAVHHLLSGPVTQVALHAGVIHPVRTIYTPLPQILEDVLRRQAENPAPAAATPSTGIESLDDAADMEGAAIDVATLCARARTDLARGNLVRAHTAITQALELDSLSVDAYFLLAQYYEQQGEWEQAITTYRRTIFLNAGFVPGIIGMANTFKSLGRRADAQRCYRNALKQLASLPPDTVIVEINNATAGELAMVVSHQLQ